MIRIATAALLIGLGGVSPALAQKVVPGPDSGALQAPRYRFSHTADGVMRLDSQTGQVTLCKPRDGTFVCNPAPDDSAPLRTELTRKDAEFDKLKSDIAQLQKQLSALKPDNAVPAAAPDSVKDDIAALKAALAAKSEQIGKLSDDLAQLKSQLAAAQPAASGAGAAPDEVAALRAEIDTLKEKVAALGKDAIGQDERHDLVTRIDELEQNSAGMLGALTRLDRQSAELSKKIEAQGKSVQQQLAAVPPPPDLKPDMSRLDKENAALKQEVAMLSADVATLKDRIAMLIKAAPTQDEVSAQRLQVAQLATENADLKSQIGALRNETAALQQKLTALAPPPPPKPPADVPSGSDHRLNLPSSEDIARARAALAEAWRRMVEMIDNLRRDMTRKDDDSVRL
jgi:predicted  nucleic acid-binding Zn-ribbon protein